jgi:hypothetical protein
MYDFILLAVHKYHVVMIFNKVLQRNVQCRTVGRRYLEKLLKGSRSLFFGMWNRKPSVDGYHCLGGTYLSLFLRPSTLKLEATKSSKAAVSYQLHCITFMILTLMGMRISYNKIERVHSVIHIYFKYSRSNTGNERHKIVLSIQICKFDCHVVVWSP